MYPFLLTALFYILHEMRVAIVHDTLVQFGGADPAFAPSVGGAMAGKGVFIADIL